MARPSRNTDLRLIKAGREILPRTGVRGLSLRQVAARAGVNLGMFSYHFKDKRDFARRVLQEIYEEFFRKFSAESGGTGPILERLQRGLLSLGYWSRDLRTLLSAIVQDMSAGEDVAVRFLRDNAPRHVSVIHALIKEAQRDGLIRPMPAAALLPFFLGAIGLPHIVVGGIDRASAWKGLGLRLEDVHNAVLSDSAIKARVEMAIKGARP